MSESKAKFLKFDGGKLRWDLMPEEVLEEICKVFMYGAQKYSDWNWYENGDDVNYSRLYNSAERHLKASKKGQDHDLESGLLELAHLGCNIMMLMALQMGKKGKDDRRRVLGKKTAEKVQEEFVPIEEVIKNIRGNKAAMKGPKG